MKSFSNNSVVNTTNSALNMVNQDVNLLKDKNSSIWDKMVGLNRNLANFGVNATKEYGKSLIGEPATRIIESALSSKNQQPQQESKPQFQIKASDLKGLDISQNVKPKAANSLHGEKQREIQETASKKASKENVKIANKEVEEARKNNTLGKGKDLEEQIEAQKKAKDINERIARGGADSVNAKIENILTNYQSGMMNSLAGIGEIPLILSGGSLQKINKAVKSDKLDKLSNAAFDKAEDMSKMYNLPTVTNQYVNDGITRTAGQVSNTIGAMTPSMAANVALPGSGVVVQGAGVGGQTATEALNPFRDNTDKANLKGIGYGTASALTEKITGGNMVGKGSLDDFAVGLIANNVTSKTKQKMAAKAYEFLGEELEEFLENQIDHAIDYVVEGKKITKEEWKKEFWETGEQTFLTTAVLNLLGLGGSTYNDVRKKVYENQNIDAKTKTAVKEVENAIDKNNLNSKKALEDFINNKLKAIKGKNIKTNNEQNIQAQNNQQIEQLQERIDNSNIPQETKQSMLDNIQDGLTQEEYNDMNEFIDMNENKTPQKTEFYNDKSAYDVKDIDKTTSVFKNNRTYTEDQIYDIEDKELRR